MPAIKKYLVAGLTICAAFSADALAQSSMSTLNLMYACDFADTSLEIRIVGNRLEANGSALDQATVESASASLISFSNQDKTAFGSINRITGDITITTTEEGQKPVQKIGRCQAIG